MQSAIDNFEKLASSVTEIAETKIEIFKLKAAGKISASMSSVLSIVMVLVFGAVAITILSFGLAYWIGSEIDSVSGGFFIMGGFYALVGLLIYANRKNWVQTPLSNLFIDKIIK